MAAYGVDEAIGALLTGDTVMLTPTGADCSAPGAPVSPLSCTHTLTERVAGLGLFVFVFRYSTDETAEVASASDMLVEFSAHIVSRPDAASHDEFRPPAQRCGSSRSTSSLGTRLRTICAKTREMSGDWRSFCMSGSETCMKGCASTAAATAPSTYTRLSPKPDRIAGALLSGTKLTVRAAAVEGRNPPGSQIDWSHTQKSSCRGSSVGFVEFVLT